MQLYKISFRAQKGDVVETGTFLVCASNAGDAEALLASTANLPPSVTTFDTSRVKPSVYELRRSDFRLSEVAPSSEKESAEPGAVHEIRASAKVFAYSESSACRRFASAVIEHASANKQVLAKHINELNIEIERADHRPRQSRVEEQSIYKEKRFFAGGAARPR
jgi:hypothetical protein